MSAIRLVPIKLNPRHDIERVLTPSIEETGNGTLLCFDGFSGRFFRSSEDAVRKALDKFNDDYVECVNYICWNDLYALLGIAATHFGYHYGYAPNNDYRNCDMLDFDITLVGKDEHFEGMDEDVLVFEPAADWCYPYDFYMEV